MGIIPAYIPAHCLAHYRTPVLCPGRATTKLYTQAGRHKKDGMQGGFTGLASIFFSNKVNSCLVQTMYKINVMDKAWLFQVMLLKMCPRENQSFSPLFAVTLAWCHLVPDCRTHHTAGGPRARLPACDEMLARSHS